MSFSRRKVVYGSVEELCISEIRLTYTIPDQGCEIEWVHDTSLAALQISEPLELIQADRTTEAAVSHAQPLTKLDESVPHDCTYDGFLVVDPNQPPKSP